MKDKNSDQKGASTFRRVRTALMLFVVGLVTLVLAQNLKLPVWVTELSISVIAAVTVGLFDRLWLYKDTQEVLESSINHAIEHQTTAIDTSLTKLDSDLQDSVVQQVTVLASESAAITKLSLETIQTGIERTIASQMGSLQAMASAGITRIYSGRNDAARDLLDDVDLENGDVDRTIRIIGISLNDFVLRPDSRLGHVWNKIESRLRAAPAKPSQARKGRLTVKIMLIDSKCFGAELRSQGEQRFRDRHTKWEGEQQQSVRTENEQAEYRLNDDVWRVACRMKDLVALSKLNGAKNGVTLECKLYRLAPILFLFWTESVCYVQQYHFWDRRDWNADVPVFKYLRAPKRSSDSTLDPYPMHQQMKEHFDWIWDSASVSVNEFVDQYVVGVESGMFQATAVNVYTDAREAADRMAYLLDTATREVAIQGVSLHSFFEPNGKLFRALYSAIDRGHVNIRILFVDPIAEQAKFRSYRESQLAGQKRTWKEYENNEGLHEKSQLYRDTKDGVERLAKLAADLVTSHIDSEWKLRLQAGIYRSAPHCFLLRVDDSVFVEQYHYGKMRDPQVKAILGKEMPVLEFANRSPVLYRDRMSLRRPAALLADHFEFAWDSALVIDLQEVANGSNSWCSPAIKHSAATAG